MEMRKDKRNGREFQKGVLPDRLSVSEASGLQPVDLLHPRCPTQTGSTPQSEELAEKTDTSELVWKDMEEVQGAPLPVAWSNHGRCHFFFLDFLSV